MYFLREKMRLIHEYENYTTGNYKLERQAKEGNKANKMADSVSMCKRGDFHMEKVSCTQI